jgi:hypothetical protein
MGEQRRNGFLERTILNVTTFFQISEEVSKKAHPLKWII